MKRITQTDFFLRKIHPLLAYIPGYDYWLLRKKSHLRKHGWFRSFRTGKSVDARGNPIPWLTYGAYDLLKKRLPPGITVFEYGCGQGTQWWASRAKRVDAVEHDKTWIDTLSTGLPPHVNILHRELGNTYEAAVTESGLFYDVIIIDGRHRNACCIQAVSRMAESGIIIFDDTNREKYKSGTDLLKSHGYKQLAFNGFGAIEFMECETSIFYRDGNIIGL